MQMKMYLWAMAAYVILLILGFVVKHMVEINRKNTNRCVSESSKTLDEFPER